MSPQHYSRLNEVVSNHYKIGELTHFEQLHLGYLNISYIIETRSGSKRKKYFFRRYKDGIKAEEIEFEHSIIRHLGARQFRLIADVIPTTDGKTYVRHLEGDGAKKVEIFYAIFDYLPGEDKYSWVGPQCRDVEIECAASILAQFHNTVADLVPAGKRYEPRILELLPEIATYVAHCSQNPGRTVFDSYFQEHLSLIQDNITRTLEALGKISGSSLPQQVIHSDYHPGNLKFEGDKIIGLFDFDWSKLDFRCLDVALAVNYFFSSWAGQEDGVLRLDNTRLFINTYQNTLKHKSGIGPLSAAELACLPHMISASNLYAFNWTIRSFYGKNVDPEEYLTYLRHGVNFMKWFVDEGNLRKLEKILEDLF